jgi:hypothetical protein
MEDSAISRLAIPGLREMQKQARAYLEAQKTTAGVPGEIVELARTTKACDREVDELKALIERFAIKKEEEEAAPSAWPSAQATGSRLNVIPHAHPGQREASWLEQSGQRLQRDRQPDRAACRAWRRRRGLSLRRISTGRF